MNNSVLNNLSRHIFEKRKDGSVEEKGRKIGPEIHCTDLKLSRNLSAHVRKSGIDEVTMMHGWIIRYLYENQDRDIFQKDIEQQFSVGRSTVTNLIQLMEKKGFVRRESVKQDARLKKVILTEKGIESQEAFEDVVEHIEAELSENIEKEDLHTFYKVLDQIRANAKKYEIKRDATNKTNLVYQLPSPTSIKR